MEQIIKEIMSDLNPQSQERKRTLREIMERINMLESELEHEGITEQNHRAALLSCYQTKELCSDTIYHLANSGRLFTPSGMLEERTFYSRACYYMQQIVELDKSISNVSHERFLQVRLLPSTAGAIKDQLKKAIAKTEDELFALGSRRGDFSHLLMHHNTLIPLNFDSYYAKLRCLFTNLEKLYEKRHIICVEYHKSRPTAMQVLLAQQQVLEHSVAQLELPRIDEEPQQPLAQAQEQQQHNPVEPPAPPAEPQQ
jgi:hypothetical protein